MTLYWKDIYDTDVEELYGSGDFLSIDFETEDIYATNEEAGVVNCGWVLYKNFQVIDYGILHRDRHDIGKELAELASRARYIVSHNAKFECSWMIRLGLDPTDYYHWCTANAFFVFAGNRPWGRMPSLSKVSRYYGAKQKKIDLVSCMIRNGVPVSSIPKVWLNRYCFRDSVLCGSIVKRQYEHMKRRRQLHLCYVRNLTSAVLSHVELNGTCLDKEAVAKEKEALIKEQEQLNLELYALVGSINFRSSNQVAKVLYEDLKFKELTHRGVVQRNKPNKAFPEGAPKTDTGTITSLRVTTKKQRKFIDLYTRLNKVNALLSKNLEYFDALCQKDGILYGQFNQQIAQTHRLTSTGVPTEVVDSNGKVSKKGCQLQNLPRIYKRLFCARKEGSVITEADASQLEFRSGGCLTYDPQVRDDVINNVDVHSVTKEALNAAGDNVDRTGAKPYTFRPMYGGKSGSEAVRAYIDVFTTKYSTMYNTQEEWVSIAANRGFLRTEYGMIFYFDGYIQANGEFSQRRNVFNYPIQGFATAEKVPIALCAAHYMIKEYGLSGFIINTVHDSIEAEHPVEETPMINAILNVAITVQAPRFVEKFYGISLFVNMGSESSTGKNWNDNFVDQNIMLEALEATNKLLDSFGVKYECSLKKGTELKVEIR